MTRCLSHLHVFSRTYSPVIYLSSPLMPLILNAPNTPILPIAPYLLLPSPLTTRVAIGMSLRVRINHSISSTIVTSISRTLVHQTSKYLQKIHDSQLHTKQSVLPQLTPGLAISNQFSAPSYEINH